MRTGRVILFRSGIGGRGLAGGEHERRFAEHVRPPKLLLHHYSKRWQAESDGGCCCRSSSHLYDVHSAVRFSFVPLYALQSRLPLSSPGMPATVFGRSLLFVLSVYCHSQYVFQLACTTGGGGV